MALGQLWGGGLLVELLKSSLVPALDGLVQRLVYPARSRRARHHSIPARGGVRALAGRTLATPIRRPLGAPLDKHPHVGFRHFPESTAFPSGQNFDREDPLGFPEGRLAGARWAEG